MRRWLLILIIVFIVFIVFLFFVWQSGLGSDILKNFGSVVGKNIPQPPDLPS